jgi:hypothetical protein
MAAAYAGHNGRDKSKLPATTLFAAILANFFQFTSAPLN